MNKNLASREGTQASNFSQFLISKPQSYASGLLSPSFHTCPSMACAPYDAEYNTYNRQNNLLKSQVRLFHFSAEHFSCFHLTLVQSKVLITAFKSLYNLTIHYLFNLLFTFLPGTLSHSGHVCNFSNNPFVPQDLCLQLFSLSEVLFLPRASRLAPLLDILSKRPW